MATHIAPTQVILVALCQDIGKAHNTTGAIAMGHPETRGWATRSVPLVPVAKTCTGLAVQPFWPDGPSIATSMPDGDSNSRWMCLMRGPFWHLGRQAVHAQALQLGSGTESPATTTQWCDKRTLVILVKKGDGRHAPMNKGFGTAGTPPQIPAVRAMRSSTVVNNGGGVRARTCR
jgi:hypothetical protein